MEKIVLTIVPTVFGWIIGHYFTNRRSLKQKRRDISLEHLINAYRVLTYEISNRDLNPDRTTKLENILSDIQLFGTPNQIQLANNLIEDVTKNDEFELDPLINDLRQELRNELNLTAVDGNVRWLRFNYNR